LVGAQAGIIGRAPIDVGAARIGIGARAGFRYDDFITFLGCTDPGCSLEYRPLGVPALDAGLDLSLEVSRLFVNVAAHGGFAYATQPYAINVDAEVGVHVIDQLYIDVGFGWQRRTAEVRGKDSGATYGTLTDQQLLGTVGVGVAF
jgi:hypothetical protein